MLRLLEVSDVGIGFDYSGWDSSVHGEYAFSYLENRGIL